jgi:hypothetical protein
LTGCNWYDERGRPILQQGEAKEEQKIKQTNDLQTEMSIWTEPTGKPGPITTYDFYDRKVSIPSNAKVHFKVTNDYSSKQTDLYSLVGQFNYKSGMGQLIFVGALCIAGGAVLCYFGMWSIGIGLAIFGFLLIACGITIEKYPWIFVCVLFLGLIGVIAFVIYTIRNKNLTTVKKDMETTLTELCDQIEAFKKVDPDAVKKYITDALAKSYNNQVIAAVTKKARKKP